MIEVKNHWGTVIFTAEAFSRYDESVRYAPGERITPDSYDEDTWVECSHGIHFFITREEAEAYR